MAIIYNSLHPFQTPLNDQSHMQSWTLYCLFQFIQITEYQFNSTKSSAVIVRKRKKRLKYKRVVIFKLAFGTQFCKFVSLNFLLLLLNCIGCLNSFQVDGLGVFRRKRIKTQTRKQSLWNGYLVKFRSEPLFY